MDTRTLPSELKAMKWRNVLKFMVNNKFVEVKDPKPHATLLEYLREARLLTGTKLGCGEGGCGACTVMVIRKEHDGRETKNSVNACLAPLCSMDGCHVITVEGIGKADSPHPVQERMAKFHGSQCGYCTPGIVMSLYTKLANNPTPTLADIEDTFDGNLCRCTGYRPILDAAKTFACDGSKCHACPNKTSCHPKGGKNIVSTTKSKILEPNEFEQYSAEMKDFAVPGIPDAVSAHSFEPLHHDGQLARWFRPSTMEDLLQLRADFPHAKVVSGNTEIRIEVKFKSMDYPTLISPAGVPELSVIRMDEGNVLEIRGNVTLSRIVEFVKEVAPTLDASVTGNMLAFRRMLNWFASTQIRNVAVIAGNVCTASPISDIGPMLVAMDAELVLLDKAGPRTCPARKFYKSYRKTDMSATEILYSVRIPPTKKNEVTQVFKQAHRRDDDISIVCACMRAVLAQEGDAWVISEFHTGFGGMAPITTRAAEVETLFTGKKLQDIDALALARDGVLKSLPLPVNVPGGMAAYRQTLSASFVAKFYGELCTTFGVVTPIVDASLAASFLTEERPVTHGTQEFVVNPTGGDLHHATDVKSPEDTMVPSEEKERGEVGIPHPHRSALLQSTGEAKYVDDMPSAINTLHAALVLSTCAKGKILKVDAFAALKMPGVVAFYSAKDLSEHQNKIGGIIQDEEIFRRDTVTCTGQPIGLVVAETYDAATIAAKLVQVEYQADPNPIITIQEALAAGSITPTSREVTEGDPDAAMKTADITLEGEIRIGGQEHFYMETNAAMVVPCEAGELTVYSSTQSTKMAQTFAAQVCGLPMHKVVCRQKRLGGGFGGKESRTAFISSAIALAAHRLQQPVRINIHRDVDMWITGTRHPFSGKYQVGAMKDGRVVALKVNVYSNGGYSTDLSESVMDRAIFHICNAYRIPNVFAKGQVCVTNTVTNTAFRGFGGPQGMLICETYMDHVAKALNMHPNDVRRVNLMQEGERTHYGQAVVNNPLNRLWDEILTRSEMAKREAEVAEFNKNNQWKKRGIAMIPTQFGINFTANFLNQATAQVMVYLDGTVLVTHGGTEMGQGLNTKVIQIAARAFGVSVEKVHISETASDKTPNASPTAASVGSDIYGMACLDACEQITDRLKPYFDKLKDNKDLSPEDRFKAAANGAYFDRISLSATGFFRAPSSGFDFQKKLPPGTPNQDRGKPFAYFTFGTACSEVEIDTLTGDMRIIRGDIVMDVGNSLNPAIDIGQVEGAYIQGVGWCMLEECIWGGGEHKWLPKGVCFTRGPGVYKIPAFNDVPKDLRVSLLADAPNPKAVHSSKAIGEPPYFTASSVFFATRNAIHAAREAQGLAPGHFIVDSPLTPERIRMACGDSIAEAFQKKAVDEGGPERPALFC